MTRSRAPFVGRPEALARPEQTPYTAKESLPPRFVPRGNDFFGAQSKEKNAETCFQTSHERVSESSASFSRALIALVSKPMVGSGDIAQHCSALLALLHLVNSGFRFGARICRGNIMLIYKFLTAEFRTESYAKND